MILETSDILNRLSGHIDDALLVAWDGCHKIYLAMDETEAGFFRSEYPHVVEGSVDEMTDTVVNWWDESCGLRFISAVRHNADDPNAGFTDVIGQFEDCDDEDDDESEEDN